MVAVEGKIVAAAVIIIVIGVVASLFATGALHSLFGSNCPGIPYAIFANTPAYGANPPLYGYNPNGFDFNVGPSSGYTGFFSEQCQITGPTQLNSFYNYSGVMFRLGSSGDSVNIYIAAPAANATIITAANMNDTAQLPRLQAAFAAYASSNCVLGPPGPNQVCSGNGLTLTQFTTNEQVEEGLINAIQGAIWYNNGLPGAQAGTSIVYSTTIPASTTASSSTTSIPGGSTTISQGVGAAGPTQGNTGGSSGSIQVSRGAGGLIGAIEGFISWLKSLLTSNYSV